jgi:hypothetical protein
VPTTVIAGNKQAIALINSTKIITAKNRLDVSYNLENPGVVDIALFNAKGALIKILSHGVQTEGRHAMTFDFADVGRGIYYFKLKAGSAEYTTDVLFVK